MAVEPVEALERIAYLLEAQRAETYKVRAFRKAADVVGDIDPVELERLAATTGCRASRVSATPPPASSQKHCEATSPPICHSF